MASYGWLRETTLLGEEEEVFIIEISLVADLNKHI
jgi:hypothetical protein